MTAVVGILNKQGAAIAADSAVTITHEMGQKKIINSANKMVRLLDDQPLAVMIVSNACLMGIPWDIIIRMYRVKRKGKTFPTFQSAIDDFLSFIELHNCFITDEQCEFFILHLLRQYFKHIDLCDSPLDILNENRKGDMNSIEGIVHQIRHNIRMYNEFLDGQGTYPHLKDYPLSEFTQQYDNTISSYLKYETSLDDEIVDIIKSDFINGFFCFLSHIEEGHETQLIFTGFGEFDQYPSLEKVNINYGIGGRLAYWINEEDIIHISDEQEYAVCPFAQTDVMDLIMDGIDPKYKKHLYRKAVKELEDMVYFSTLQLESESESQNISSCLEKLDIEPVINELTNNLSKIIQEGRHTQFYDSVPGMSPSEMSHLADCLVSVTSLSRHINFEQEGVGGLVDLAILTKESGFQWINRKSWCDTPGSDGFKI